MTTGTPINKEEATSFSPGVAQKLISAPVGFLGAYPLPLVGDGNIEENSAIFLFHCCSCLGGLLHPRFHTGVSKVWAPQYSVRENTFPFYISCDSYRDDRMIQYENKILLCTITFSFSKFFINELLVKL